MKTSEFADEYLHDDFLINFCTGGPLVGGGIKK